MGWEKLRCGGLLRTDHADYRTGAGRLRKRFLSGYENYIKEEEDKIISKYNVLLSIRYYLLFAFYLKIEKRGFYVTKYSELTKDYSIIYDKNTIHFTELVV